MTKEEFENNDKPLVMLVSLNPETGEVLYDIYNWRIADSFMKDYKKDFPDMLHFRTINKAGIEERLKLFGVYEVE